jgi:16S rRNA (cytosine1402-N4)-methyltransferase
MPPITYHRPVLLDAVLAAAKGARRVVDGTVGGGGHAERLRAAGAEVLAVDRDAEAIAAARTRLGEERVTWITGRFAAPEVLAAIARFAPDFILLDLGVSSRHLDSDQRGFSFREGVALDMRMSEEGTTAAELLNGWSEPELARVFRDYGDERRARRLAHAVIERRARAPLATSDDLVGAIRRALGPRSGAPEFARLFQAVRIAVNDERSELETALPALRDALRPGGRLAVITYHSGEDRIVKTQFREWARSCICPPGQPICTCRGHALGRITPRRPVAPSGEEVAGNPRARSAKLRVFETADGR